MSTLQELSDELVTADMLGKLLVPSEGGVGTLKRIYPRTFSGPEAAAEIVKIEGLASPCGILAVGLEATRNEDHHVAGKVPSVGNDEEIQFAIVTTDARKEPARLTFLYDHKDLMDTHIEGNFIEDTVITGFVAYRPELMDRSSFTDPDIFATVWLIRISMFNC